MNAELEAIFTAALARAEAALAEAQAAHAAIVRGYQAAQERTILAGSQRLKA